MAPQWLPEVLRAQTTAQAVMARMRQVAAHHPHAAAQMMHCAEVPREAAMMLFAGARLQAANDQASGPESA